MNLTAIREKIKNTTDYSPDRQPFSAQLDELVNDAYYAIWTHKRWVFATHTEPYRFFIDILPDRDNENVPAPATNVTATWVQGERLVTFSHAIDRLQKVGHLEGPDVWEGQPISIEKREYIIEKVNSGTTLIVNEPIVAPTPAQPSINWLIKKRWYDLPEDLLELLYLGHRDYPYNASQGSFSPYGKATAIMPRREEQVDLRADYKASYAEAYIWSPYRMVKPAERIKLAQSNDTGSGFTANGYYEICWAFLKDGKVGALSEPATLKVTSANNSINVNFTSWDDSNIVADPYNNQDELPTPWRGYRKVIYYNKNVDKLTGERRGLPCWIAIINGGSNRNLETFNERVVVSDQLATYRIDNANQMDNGQERYVEIDGQHTQIRPYPRVDGFDEEVKQVKADQNILQFHDFRRDAIIRYYKKPKDLLLGTDVPEMPYEFHQLIVYKALEDIYLKLGQEGLSTTYARRIENEMKELKKRYVDHIDSHVRRGQFSSGGRGVLYDMNSLKHLG